MIVKMNVQRIGNEDPDKRWSEEFDSETTNCLRHYDASLSAMEYSEAVIMFFNNTLKPGESKREVVGAREITGFEND